MLRSKGVICFYLSSDLMKNYSKLEDVVDALGLWDKFERKSVLIEPNNVVAKIK